MLAFVSSTTTMRSLAALVRLKSPQKTAAPGFAVVVAPAPLVKPAKNSASDV